jgi:hypothetical protein
VNHPEAIAKLRPPVIARLQGGLGNQLYQYAAGRSLADFLSRPLLLDARTIRPEAPVRHYDLGAFRIREQFVSGLEAFRTRWVGSVRAGRVFKTMFAGARSYKYIRDREEGFDEGIFADHAGPIVLHGYWQSYRYFERIADELRNEVVFRADPDPSSAALLRDIESSDSVCVHVRRGDYVSNPAFKAALGACGVEYYDCALGIIVARVARPTFYLFSDDLDWAKANLHVPGPLVPVDHNKGRSDVEDLRLMSRCRHFVIANSSFSWWGAWLGRDRGGTVVAPSRWFNSDKTPATDRIPPGWIRV